MGLIPSSGRATAVASGVCNRAESGERPRNVVNSGNARTYVPAVYFSANNRECAYLLHHFSHAAFSVTFNMSLEPPAHHTALVH